MRPGTTNAPDSHWSYMLVDVINPTDGVTIVHEDGEPTVRVSPKLKDADPGKFEHIMSFLKMHGVKVEIIREQCAKCTGNPNCVGYDVWREVQEKPSED